MSLPEGLLLSFYGDDFTGSTDGMEALAKAGLRTVLFLEPPSLAQLARFEGVRAIGVAGISRSLTPEEMDAELPSLFAKLRALPAPLFHVKICSTFDSAPHIGSVGRTIEIGQQVFANRYVPLLVGAPPLGRFCVFGNLFARYSADTPQSVYRLDRHPTMGQHPVTPMDEADLRLHLGQQTAQNIGLMNVLHLKGVIEEVDQKLAHLLADEKPGIVLFDTLTDTHLHTVGRLLWQEAQASPPLFCIGSSGVEYALTDYWRTQGWLPDPPVFTVGPAEQIVVVSGSCSPVTAQQIEWGVANGFAEIALDPVCLLTLESAESVRRAAIEEALALLAQGKSVLLHTCKGPDDPRLHETRRYLQETGKSHEGGRRLGEAQGRLLREILASSGVRRAVVAGGDTSGYVARELGIEALEMAAPMAPGSPLCRASAPGSPLDGLELLFKGGQVGKVDLFGSILRGNAP